MPSFFPPPSAGRCQPLALLTAFAALPLAAQAEILPPPGIIDWAPEFSAAYAPVNLFDNNATDYASQNAGTGMFLEFQFPSPATFDRIVVVSRDSPAGGDWLGGFTLTMDDTVSRSVEREPQRGVSGLHSLGAAVTASKVRLQADSIGTGGATNTGAMEIFFLKAPAGSVPVDSVAVIGSAPAFNADYAASNAADGLVGRSAAAGKRPEYASLSRGVETYVDFDLGAVLPVTGFDWFDRIASADRVTAFDLIFSQNATFGDGDDQVMSFDNSASAIGVSGSFAAVNARYVRYDVTAVQGSANANTGLSEMVFYRNSGGSAVAPQISIPPTAVTRFVSENHTFTVSATGSAPLSYEWRKGGTLIADQTGPSLTLTNIQPADAGDYTVTVKNSAGSVTSAAAHLTVDSSPGNPAQGRFVWLKFDETTGLTAADAAGGDNPGTLLNFIGDDAQWQPGRFNNAVSFNTSGPAGEVVTMEAPASLDFSTTGIFSASCWVKAPAGLAQTSGAALLCKGGGAGGEQFCLDVFGGYRFYVRDASTPTVVTSISTGILPNGEWQHLAMVYDQPQSRMRLYVNGELAGSAVPLPTLFSNADPVSIGARKPNTNPETAYDLAFQGLIDEVSFYNRSLGPADIAAVSPFIKAPLTGGLVFGGESFTFTASAAGAAPLSYQWLKNGAPVAGATGGTLTIENAGASDQADYAVTITNAAGSITTSSARLTVEASAPDLNRGLLSWLKFDETNGLTAVDASGKNHPGVLENFANGNIPWQTGKTGGAVGFSLSNPDSMEVVTVADAGDLDLTASGAFTVSGWVKPAEGAPQKAGAGLLCKGGGGGGEQFCVDLQAAGYRFYVWNGGTPNAATVLQTTVQPSGDWQCVTAVFNLAAKRMQLYVDGSLAGSVTPPATMLFNADPFVIGSRTASMASLDYTLNFQGLIDDVHLYNRDLSPAEITSLAAVAPPAVLPVLNIVRNGANVEISWPAEVTDWTLEESSTMQPLSWSASAGVVNNRLVIPAPAGRKFYRLRQ